ncbi:ATP-dependent helicase [Fenollaria sporofastidiosus]|uniref:ATP-dependent helicase n=1 Tax=Fenollaria sporofastidiosus TaxID=2811778 RepID=UPI001BFFF635|nr:ATP-dependent helicase [Fenollaria sporofastidiosus]
MKLNPNQLKASRHDSGPALVLAVPGSGKTTVIVNRIKYLIKEKGVSPYKVLAITFAKSQQLDMQRRILEALDDNYSKEVSVLTIHALSYKIIREYERYKKTKYTLLDVEDAPRSRDILRKIYIQKLKTYPSEEEIDQIQSILGYIKNTNEDYIDADGPFEYKVVVDDFEAYKKKKHLIDFDDMLIMANDLLEKDKHIISKFKDKYEYILLDEGQDTSLIQFMILDKLINTDKNFFVVADDDQSIYKFRGACPERILNFEKYYKGAELYRLSENYRSTPSIINASNRLIKNNKLRYTKELSTSSSDKTPVNIKLFGKDLDEYRYIAKYLKSASETVAILYRNNISQIPLAEFLERYLISFTSYDKKERFFTHWIIDDIFDIYNFSLNMNDAALFRKIYYKIKGYLSKDDINGLYALTDIDVLKTLYSSESIQSYKKDYILQLMKDFKALRKMKPSNIIDYIVNDMNYRGYLRSKGRDKSESFNKLLTMIYFLKEIALYTKSMDELKLRLNVLRNKIYSQNESNVILSTIHGAKGLEFDTVFLVDIVDDEIPGSNNASDVELEEERRIFYVGMTRAKKNLNICAFKERNNTDYEISQFIEEIKK